MKNQDKEIEDFEVWLRAADQSWFLLIEIGDAVSERGLSSHGTSGSVKHNYQNLPKVHGRKFAPKGDLTLPNEVLEAMMKSAIPFCLVQLATRQFSSGEMAGVCSQHNPVHRGAVTLLCSEAGYLVASLATPTRRAGNI